MAESDTKIPEVQAEPKVRTRPKETPVQIACNILIIILMIVYHQTNCFRDINSSTLNDWINILLYNPRQLLDRDITFNGVLQAVITLHRNIISDLSSFHTILSALPYGNYFASVVVAILYLFLLHPAALAVWLVLESGQTVVEWFKMRFGPS